jgi:hypothetical protein
MRILVLYNVYPFINSTGAYTPINARFHALALSQT